MSKTYVIAVIRLPLELHTDGTFTTLNDNIDFEFIPVKDIPPKKANGIELASIELDEIIGGLFKLESSIRDKKTKRVRNKNKTFKNIVGSFTNNYTPKNYHI